MEALLAAGAVFVGIFAVVFLLGSVVTGSSGVKTRMRRLVDEAKKEQQTGLPDGRHDETPFFARLLRGSALADRLSIELSSAGLPMRSGEFICAATGLAVIVLLIFMIVTGNALLSLVLACTAGAALPMLTIRMLQRRRRAAFDRQIVDALMLMASSLRSGFSVQTAMRIVAEEMEPPISYEFERILAEISSGRPMETALRRSVVRMDSYDFDLIVTAMSIYLQVGGNLADLLDAIAVTIRQRVRIKGEMRALTAEGRISGIVLILLPLVFAALIMTIKPAYLAILIDEPIGRIMIGAAVGLQIIGGLIIKKMLVLDI